MLPFRWNLIESAIGVPAATFTICSTANAKSC
jgi:hypothetical protein